MSELFTNPKLVSYLIISLSGLMIGVLTAPTLWRNRTKLDRPSTMLVGFFFLEGVTNAIYFSYWIVENLLGHPAWMVNSGSITSLAMIKAGMNLLVIWLFVRLRLGH